MRLEDTTRQKSGQLELPLGSRGEAPRAERSGEVPTALNGTERSGATTTLLMEQVVERSNIEAALKKVLQNKGSPGIDGMTVQELSTHMAEHWESLRASLLAGTYQPKPVRRQEIPKSGGGVRQLGIPCALDRLVQQCILQVLQPRFDPSFSEHSYGFRPGRRAHDAVRAAQKYIQQGYSWVADVDLAQFFDRFNHDVLMGRLSRRIEDKRLLGLIRNYLNAGIMAGGVVIERHEGVPQGGPLSPLLANTLLDEVDKIAKKTRELKRGVAGKALETMKERVRAITSRTGGRSIPGVIAELRPYLLGWKAYFKFQERPSLFRDLDGWIRHRLRMLHLKHWKNGPNAYRQLRARGLSENDARKVAGNLRSWWRNSHMALNWALPPSYFDSLGLPRLAA